MKKPFLLAGLCGVALLLSGVVAWEYRTWRRESVFTLPASGRMATPWPVDGAAPVPVAAGGDPVGPILARPLFNPTRRPVAAPEAVASAVAAAPVLPRLTGVLVSKTRSSAIFAGPPEGKSIVATEGGWIGRYQVQSIRAGEVTLSSPDGTAILRPTFAPIQPGQPGVPAAAVNGGPLGIGPASPGLPNPGPVPDIGRPSILDQLRRTTPSVAIPGLPTPDPTATPGQ